MDAGVNPRVADGAGEGEQGEEGARLGSSGPVGEGERRGGVAGGEGARPRHAAATALGDAKVDLDRAHTPRQGLAEQVRRRRGERQRCDSLAGGAPAAGPVEDGEGGGRPEPELAVIGGAREAQHRRVETRRARRPDPGVDRGIDGCGSCERSTHRPMI
jgi:hypothetical protein